ncbi:hypothetical protein EIN_280740 [Entamoeba invadens IP1]|uniref:TLDc domain-containing protein n=1 Tax=Entamoeba invadens IP1 TaxID=370355 RepID=A0A0A1UBG8_ENTIV|nr:hypothetical protein EIN_280740 [Entamoeba invadens IP1]ELP91007.1 hypothetical protein EIN_280740 [Entamoeba invadens IP1]|eukprot:XP_004257778.1 hypothetical protein EIN_280740 [Entamoeba invadens IP1]
MQNPLSLKENESKIIERATYKKIKGILFDSFGKDNFDIHTSTLNKKLLGEDNFCIIFEDNSSSKFGIHITQKVTKQRQWITDDKAMIFKITTNGCEDLHRYKLDKKYSNMAFYLPSKDDEELLLCGYDDLTIYKNRNKPVDCDGYYFGIDRYLFNGNIFYLHRMIVVKLQ